MGEMLFAAFVSCSFGRWQRNCINTVGEILCQSCTDQRVQIFPLCLKFFHFFSFLGLLNV